VLGFGDGGVVVVVPVEGPRRRPVLNTKD
jgi:hypothetical protein